MPDFNIFIAGVRIIFRTSHQSDITCVRELFLYHLDEEKQRREPGFSHTVIVESLDNSPNIVEIARLRWSGQVNSGMPAQWYDTASGNENLICVGDDIVISHQPEQRLTVCYLVELSDGVSKKHRPNLSGCVFFLIQSILSMYGRYCLHASCVSKEGKACLFLGKSGEGKSTISYRLAKHGFEYMGDDLVFLSLADEGGLVVDAYLSRVKLQKKMTSEAKTAIDILKDGKSNYAYQSKLVAIVRLQRDLLGKESLFVPANPTEVFEWLINSANNSRIQYHPRLWLDICEKAAGIPAYTLMFGDKEYFNPETVNDILQNGL